MQLDSIKITDYINNTNEAKIIGEGISKPDAQMEKKSIGDTLRNLSIDSANYGRNGMPKNDITKKIKEVEGLGQELVKNMSVLGSSLGASAIGSQMDEGFDPMDMDKEAIVTVVDKIKMQLAKSGHDISKMGGLSDAEIMNMSATVSQAKAMESELNQGLSQENIRYLVDNELEPTIENIYNATFKAPDKSMSSQMDELSDDKVDEIYENIKGQIEEIKNQTDDGFLVEANEDEIEATVKEMLSLKLPITEDNIEYYNKLSSYTKPEEALVDGAILDILAEDKPAKDAYLIEGYSLMDKAREISDKIMSIDENSLPDITARRQLEEIRLSMSVEANFRLLKQGISIDTTDLNDLVEKLKSVENEMIKASFESIMGDETENVEGKIADVPSEWIELYKDTKSAIEDVKAMPLSAVGAMERILDSSLKDISESARVSRDTYLRANESYEALMTKPRADMGDSITKAFRNVDDILEDIGLEITDENRRAVRVLAYNTMDINKASVENMRYSLESVTRTIKNLTPRVVMEMIRRGDNPLDKSLAELNEKANEIKSEVGNDEEGFAKFLWKAEHSEGLSKEERDSYIGIYRLINQIEAKDGAAVGALVHQGADVTLRNLLSVSRSNKHSNREWTIDDSFGGLSEVKIKDLPIDEQIEAVFYTNRLRDAKEAMTPSKLSAIGEEDVYMNMNVDVLASALEAASDDTFVEDAYNEYVAKEVEENLVTNEEVEKILHAFDISDSPANINAINELLKDRNNVFKKLFEKVDLEAVVEDLWEDFGEACKTPEDMAKAEHELAKRAENAMKNMLVTEEVTYIDIKGMKLVKTQIKAMDKMAKDETYHIPVLVGDEVGNMTLKIVHGKDEKGLVSLAMSADSVGTVSASFKYEAGSIEGTIDCDDSQFREVLSGQINQIARDMAESTSLPISMLVQNKESVNVNGVYDSNYDFEKISASEDTVTSAKLYAVAKSFIEGLGELM